MVDYPKGFVPPYYIDYTVPCTNCFGEGRYEIETGKRVVCEICNGSGDVKSDPPEIENEELNDE